MAAFTSIAIGAAVATTASLGGSLIAGFGWFGSFAIRAALGVALNALSPKPKNQATGRGYDVNAFGSALDHQIIYGRTKAGGAVVYDSATGPDNKYLNRIIAFAGHEIDAFEEIYINDDLLVFDTLYNYTIDVTYTVGGGESSETVSSTLVINGATTSYANGANLTTAQVNGLFEEANEGNPRGDGAYTTAQVSSVSSSNGVVSPEQYKGKVRINQHLGADDQVADTDLVAETASLTDGKWTSQHRLRGIAYLYVRFEYDQDAFPNGVPVITSVIRGKKVYDPRTGTTAWSSNPALCLRDYLTNVGYGLGESADNVDDDLVSTAAEVCRRFNFPVLTGDARFTCNGAFTTDLTPYDLLNDLLTPMGGMLWYGQGKWRMKPAYYTAPTLSFDEDDLRSSVSLSTRHSRRDNFNTVKGTFKGAESNWQITDYPEVSNTDFVTEDGGLPSVIDLDLPFTSDSEIARRIARIALERNRQQLTISASFGIRAFEVQVGDIIRLSNSRFGWTNKEFEVSSWTFGFSGEYDLQVQMVLREISASVFDDVSDGVVYSQDNTSLPNPFIGNNISDLTASGGGKLQGDGTFVNSAILDWTPATSAFVSYYEVEWRPTTDSTYFSTTTTNSNAEISPLIDGVEYTIRVRAVSSFGNKGVHSYITFVAGGDVTAPNVPTTLVATGDLGFINLNWVSPADTDLNYTEVWESVTSTLGDATQIARAFGNSYNRGNLPALTTRYYWLRSVDFSENKSGFVGPVSATSRQVVASDIGDAVIDYGSFTSGVTEIFDGIQSDFTEVQATFDTVQSDLDSILVDLSNRVLVSDYNITVDYQQQLEDATNQLATDALELALKASSLETRINDAGITVDPSTGSVTIQGLSAVEDRVNEVEIDLDAVEGELALKATTAYVNNAIAAATLPEATLAELEDLEARVDTVEVNLDSIEGAITLTSTGSLYDVNDGTLGVEALEGRITVAEGEIELKATQTELDDVETRLGSAEITLNSIDVPAITLAVQDVRQISNKQEDLSELTLKEVLGRYEDREYVRRDVAIARQEISADVDDQGNAIATLRTELAAQIEDNQASIVSEQQARASADSALASDITELQADLVIAEGNVSANGSAISSLDTRVTSAEGVITSQSSDITSLESGLSSLQTDVSGLETDTSANATAISGLNTRVTSAEGTISIQSSSITDLRSDLGVVQNDVLGLETDTSANATAISGLDTRVTANEGSITSQASSITSLQSGLSSTQTDVTGLQGDVSSLETDTSANATAISGLDTRVTSAEGTISSQSSSLTSLSSDVSSLQTDVSGLEADTSANATAISGLDTRVTSAEGSITSQASSITSLQSALSTTNSNVSGNATAISGLDTRVTDNEGDITSQATSISSLESTVNNPTTGLAATRARVTTVENTKVDASGAVAAVQTEISAEYGSLSAMATATSFSEAGVDELLSGFRWQARAGGVAGEVELVSDGVASLFKVSADRLQFVGGLTEFFGNVEITGDLIVNGAITTDKIFADSVTNILQVGDGVERLNPNAVVIQTPTITNGSATAAFLAGLSSTAGGWFQNRGILSAVLIGEAPAGDLYTSVGLDGEKHLEGYLKLRGGDFIHTVSVVVDRPGQDITQVAVVGDFDNLASGAVKIRGIHMFFIPFKK